MKKQENTQNVIVELDFDELNKNIRKVDKNGRLLANHGYITNDITYIDDKIILHRFAYLKGTMEAIDLLSNILGSIDYSLKYHYYLSTDGDDIVECYGNIPENIDDFDCSYIKLVNPIDENGYYMYSKSEEDNIINNIFCKHRKEILIEANKMKKYYKEYYTRLYDRGRTVK